MVRDSFLGPTWLIRCAPSAQSSDWVGSLPPKKEGKKKWKLEERKKLCTKACSKKESMCLVQLLFVGKLTIVWECTAWRAYFHFSVRICYIPRISKCRVESDLDLCKLRRDLQIQCGCAMATNTLRLRNGDFRLKTRLAAKCHRPGALFLQVPKLCTDLDSALL